MSVQNGGVIKDHSLNLECGTSLAELEYTTEVEQQQRQYEEKKNNINNHNIQTNTNNATITTTSATNDISLQQQIDTIQNSLADDIVTKNNNHSKVDALQQQQQQPVLSMFTSPFETPQSRHGSGQTEIPEVERYASVPLIYCDQTASNRPLKSVEKFIHDTCLPLYGNTHTNTSITGSQSTAFVAEARQIVAEGVNAKISGKAASDVVLFAGNGTTSAVELLVDCLGIKNHDGNNDNRPVVFVGCYEHHSNLIPWRESGCEIVMIPECDETKDVNLKYLEKMLQLPKYNNRIKMGTFTAASNVTGKISNVNQIAVTLHRFGALAFFDYATGAPYLPIDMNPPPSGDYTAADLAKDAVFISPHKMIGGINTPGILILKKHLVNQTNAPGRSGGGTVFYVTHTHHRFLSNRIERYEGGTPNVVGIMRAGLTFLVKRKIENNYKRAVNFSCTTSTTCQVQNKDEFVPKTILEDDCSTYSYVVDKLSQTAPNIVILGKTNPVQKGRNLPIFSFLVKCGKRFLHYNYVCAILNDLFGIQSRGGCQCSGPYSQHLLGLTKLVDGKEIPNDENDMIESALLHYKERAELLRPGYTRLSLPFKGLRREEIEYVVKALEWVSKHAWSLICQYRCNHRTGEWRHFSRQGKPLGRTERRWLSHFDLSTNRSNRTMNEMSEKNLTDILDKALENANYQLEVARNEQKYMKQAMKMTDDSAILDGDENLESLRWYVYPKECAQFLMQGYLTVPETLSSTILGAIRPLSETNKILSVEKQSSSSIETSMPFTKNCNDTFQFRDGEEHAGQASFQEIANGYNDGELSDNCFVFLPEDDEWLPIEQFLTNVTRREKAKCSEKRESSKMDVDMVSGDDERKDESSEMDVDRGNGIEEQKAKTASSTTSIAPEVIGKKEVKVIDSSREKKKPSRDSSSWGKSAPVRVIPSTSLPYDSAAPESNSTSNKTSVEKTTAQIQSNKRKKGNNNHIRPPPKIMKYIIQATIQFEMIEEGDRLLLGLSGGKDSLTLLHCLLELRRKLPTKFEIEVCTIDPMTPSFDPSPLIPYVESLGLKYHYVKDNIVERANSGGKNGTIVTSLCAYCARMKRGNLYSTARKNSCNKLVLAQHLDDCAESCFMSMMHNGFIRTMKAKYQINAGDLTVIRPMVYCRESLMTEFAKANNLPIINENCPACFEEPKERARVKKLLSREETLYPNIYDNIRRSLIPVMHDDMTAILKCYTEEAVSKSRKNRGSGKKNKKRSRDESNEVAKETEVTTNGTHSIGDSASPLALFSDDDLLKEIVRRKSQKFRLAGAMKRLDDEPPNEAEAAKIAPTA